MKEKIIQILQWLHENQAWDLAEMFIVWLSQNVFKESYVESIVGFLIIAIQLTKDKHQQEELQQAYIKLQTLKQQEAKERKFENYEQILQNIF